MSVQDQAITDRYAIYNGDCVEVLKGVASESVHLTIYSPPFCGAVPVQFRSTGHEQRHRQG